MQMVRTGARRMRDMGEQRRVRQLSEALRRAVPGGVCERAAPEPGPDVLPGELGNLLQASVRQQQGQMV